jgi:hypothetical protein
MDHVDHDRGLHRMPPCCVAARIVHRLSLGRPFGLNAAHLDQNRGVIINDGYARELCPMLPQMLP